MKKLVAFLTLFVMLLDIANAETTDYEIASSYFKDKFEKLGIPSALQGEAYKRVFNEYMDEGVGQLWGNDEYEKLANIRERYCKKGLYEACQRLGEQYMLGVGVQRDLDMAIVLMSYNLMNSKYDYLRLRGKEMLNFVSSLKKDNMDADAAMNLSAGIWRLMMKECDSGKRDEPYCLMFFILSDVVPNHLTANKVNGKRYLAVDMALDKMGEDVKKHESGSQPISASQFFSVLEYIRKMIPSDQISGSSANPPKQSPPKSIAQPVTPQSNSQNLAQKHKFTDGFSIDVNSGIVLDAIYGLMWQDTAEIFKGSYKDAVSYCENLNYGGYSDWRLPSASELLSITDYGRYKPAINKAFKHVGKDGSDKYGSYWSSTGASFDAGGVWVVQFGSGFDNWVKINSADNFARCVRNLK